VRALLQLAHRRRDLRLQSSSLARKVSRAPEQHGIFVTAGEPLVEELLLAVGFFPYDRQLLLVGLFLRPQAS